MEFGSEYVYLSRNEADDVEFVAEDDQNQLLEYKNVTEGKSTVASDSGVSTTSADEEVCLLDILDTAGQEEFSAMREQYIQTGQAFLIVYSITSQESLDEASSIYSWLLQVKNVKSAPAILVGNKNDLESERQVILKEGQDVAKSHGIPFMETSAKTGDNVQECFAELVRQTPKSENGLYRVVVLGSGGVGKSSITLRYVQNDFVESYDPTIEDNYRKEVTIQNLPKDRKKESPKSESNLRQTSKSQQRRSAPPQRQTKSVQRSLSQRLKDKFSFRKKKSPDKAQAANVTTSGIVGDSDDEISSEEEEEEQQQILNVDSVTKKEKLMKGDSSTSASGVQGASVSGSGNIVKEVKGDSNVLVLSLGTLENEPEVMTGDPVFCQKCQAILSAISELSNSENEGASPQTWKCEFCDFENTGVDVTKEEIPKTDQVDFILEAAPPPEVLAEASKKGIIVYCLDISGSMSTTARVPTLQAEWARSRGRSTREHISRLECVKTAVKRQLERLNLEQPDKQIMLVTFSAGVTIIGDGQKSPVHVDGCSHKAYEELLKYGQDEAKNWTLRSIKDSFSALTSEVSSVDEGGMTALGPALTVCVGLVSDKPSSEIILCTDGEPNVGVGASRDGPDFYKKIGEFAKSQQTTISILGIEGDSMQMEIVKQCAKPTGGNVNILHPLELEREIRQISQNPIIATNVELVLMVHPALCIEIPGCKEKNSKVTKTIGNALRENDMSFRFKLKTTEDDVSLDTLPFQAQIKYTRKNGMKCVRVLSQKKKGTHDRKMMEETTNVEIVGLAAVQESACIAEQGRVQTAQRHLNNYNRYFFDNASKYRNVSSEQYYGFTSEAREVQEQISRPHTSSASSSSDKTAKLLHQKQMVSRSKMSRGVDKSVTKKKTSSDVAKNFYSHKFE